MLVYNRDLPHVVFEMNSSRGNAVRDARTGRFIGEVSAGRHSRHRPWRSSQGPVTRAAFSYGTAMPDGVTRGFTGRRPDPSRHSGVTRNVEGAPSRARLLPM